MKFDDFKITTRVRKINLWAQIVLAIILYFGLNFLASRHYTRIDFSENHKNSLSPESVAYIKNLKSPIEIYVVVSTQNFANENTDVIKNLRSFLSQYAYESKAPAKIKISFVNSFVENKRVEDLAKRFGSGIENSVIVAGENMAKVQIVPISDFFTNVDDSKKNFNGESLMTSAILRASQEKQPKIYFTKGHGELDIKSVHVTNGLSEFADALQNRNYQLDTIKLSEVKALPKDADMIAIVAPDVPFAPIEIEHLRKYLLKDNGRVVVFLRMGSARGLEDLFYEWGILSDDMQIFDINGDFESAGGDLIARTFPEKSHPIVKYLLSSEMPVQFGSVRPVRQDLGAANDDSLKLSALILSSATSWAEKSYRHVGVPRFDEAFDLSGPIPLAMVASRTGGKEHGLNIPGGKLAVFGDENFISNNWFNRLGNSMLAINTVNWMLEEDGTLNIPPRTMKIYSITVSHNQLVGLAVRFFILPFSILALGMVVSFIRRN